jgi:hypothetical protein
MTSPVLLGTYTPKGKYILFIKREYRVRVTKCNVAALVKRQLKEFPYEQTKDLSHIV